MLVWFGIFGGGGINLFRECARAHTKVGKGEGKRESGNLKLTLHWAPEPTVGLNLITLDHNLREKSRVQRLTDRATQALQ